MVGGGGWIRTRDTGEVCTAYKAGGFDRSPTPPLTHQDINKGKRVFSFVDCLYGRLPAMTLLPRHRLRMERGSSPEAYECYLNIFVKAGNNEGQQGKVRQGSSGVAQISARATQKEGKEAEWLDCFRFGSEFLVGELYPAQQGRNGLSEHPAFQLAAIEPIRKLIQVTLKVLYRNLVERAYQSALEKRECVFDGVGVRVPDTVAPAVIDSLVFPFELLQQGPFVSSGFVGEDIFDEAAHVVFNDRLHYLPLGIRHDNEAQLTATLDHAHYNVFLRALGAWLPLTRNFGADIGFVNLYLLALLTKQPALLRHCFADSVAQEPSRPIVDPQVPLELVRAHALLGVADHSNRHEPSIQRKVGLVKDRASSRSELVQAFALQALIDPPRPGPKIGAPRTPARSLASGSNIQLESLDLEAATFDAADPVRPAHPLQIVQAGILSSELTGYVYQAHRSLQ